MKKKILLITALALIFAVGCQKKEEKPAPASPQGALTQPAAPNPWTSQAAAPKAGGDPHAGLPAAEFTKGGVAHKGKVLQKIDAAGYSYLEVEEKGKKLWVAVMQAEVKKGDIVEIPESPVMVKFTSKTLNRTFDEILFASGVRVVKP
ncbi:MAG: hypothetical protein K0B01_00370 [Syntrophobacterales bacterium]|nr:hypothetical protein [Syntrophobacterales bacterium]